jgi:hypothetical protein
MRVVPIITVISAVAFGAAVYFWQTRGVGEEPAPEAMPTAGSPPAEAEAPRARPGPAPGTPEYTAIQTSYSEGFQSSNDLLAFAQSMHKMAQEGDDAAQYWLFRALYRCGAYYDVAFEVDPSQPGRQPLALDQAMQKETKNPQIGSQEVLELSQQCKRLREGGTSQFGNAKEWLEKASKTGYPLAQIRMAYELVGGGGQASSARELAFAALRSRDPEVILQTEAVATLLSAGESAQERHKWVWTLAGCQRGADCGPNAEWVRRACVTDKRCEQYEGGLDIVRRQTGPQFAELEELARELNAKIDAQKWNELGF